MQCENTLCVFPTIRSVTAINLRRLHFQTSVWELLFEQLFKTLTDFTERHLWPSWFERSTWKHNSLGGTKLKDKLIFHPFLLTFSQFSVNFRQVSAWLLRAQFFLPGARGWGLVAHVPEGGDWACSSRTSNTLNMCFSANLLHLNRSSTVGAGSRPMPWRNISVSPSFGT